MSTWPAPTRYSTTLGDFSYDVNNPVYGFFVQDDWTLSPRLTLNVGMRYDLEPKVTNKDMPDPLDEGPRSIDADNIAPRIGFAFDPAGDGRTVIRGGVGSYYGNILLNIPMNEARDRNERVSVVVANPSLTDPLGRTHAGGLPGTEPPAGAHADGQRGTGLRARIRRRSASPTRSAIATRSRPITCTPKAATSR